MVHALHETHRLLKPRGTLIDIHPRAEPSELAVLQGAQHLHSEAWPRQSLEDYRDADRVIKASIDKKLFTFQGTMTFDFFTYASTASELRGFFQKANAYDHSSKDPVVEATRAEIASRVDRLVASSSPNAEVAFRERAAVTVLMPVR